MAKSSGKQYTEEWFLSRNYVKGADGSYSPPKFVRDLKPSAELVVKQRVNNSPDFEIKSIVTEWFIKGYSVPSKKNSRQNFVKNGRQISIPSKKHAEYVKMTAMQFQIFGIEFRNAIKHYNLQYPLRVEFTFVRATKHRWDYCNAVQTIEDIMTDNKWIEDDSADHLIPIFMPYVYDKEMPGVIIKLLTNV